jgi:hypothetical protein
MICVSLQCWERAYSNTVQAAQTVVLKGASFPWENSNGKTGNQTQNLMTTKTGDWLYEASAVPVNVQRL